MKHLFIINPIAGGKKGRFEDTKREIETCVLNLDAPYEIYVTNAPHDATKKVKKVADNEEMLYVYACGGDGTLNECVNGAVNRDNVVVTHYPCGTGNDFIKTFGTGNTHKFHDLQQLMAGEARALDVINCDGRYGINICSVGIDARIGNDVHKYSSIPIIGGSTGYVTSLIVNVIKGVKQRFKITSEQFKLDADITLMCACNGRYYGGGFNPVPDALPDDGIIDFLIIKEVSRLKVAQIVKTYAQGKYRELADVITHVRGESMEIEGEKEFVINIDGEIIRRKKISFNIVAGGVKFLVPKGV
jgi:YegS/Rv2252/BmrU family lipid kinase